VKAKNLPDGDKRVTNDPMEATYVGIKMWAQAVEQAGTTDVDAVRQAVGGQTVRAPSGFDLVMDGKNHHLNKPVYIAEVQADGQFKIVWKTDGPIRAMPWSPYVPESAKKIADWSWPWACGNCTEAKYKGGVIAPAAAATAVTPAAK
jgi:urea transport system substrate-binding protein